MKLHILQTGKFKLDGGAMFGVVPKRMWSKLNPPDDENLCTWGLRCLLIEDGQQKILIDTGIGHKQDDRFKKHFYPHETEEFADLLSKINLTEGDITDVIITHFHFDHVGGAVKYNEKGQLVPTFPNAKYWSNKKHYDWAINPNPRESASFLKENFVPLMEHQVLHFVDTDPGVSFNAFINFDFVYGHTEAMMIPYIKLQSGNTLVYCADLLPSHHHIPMPYVMAYDIRPLETLKEKQTLFDRVTDGNHFLFYEHDDVMACSSVQVSETGRVVFGSAFDLSTIMK
ncbi:MAG: MBL fold metallo-hydrolase [Saprospiraceae bacterium]